MYKNFGRFMLGLVLTLCLSSVAHGQQTISVDSKASLLMEAETGKILHENNAHEKLAPASVTKVMTMLLIYEALEQERIRWDDIVTVSAHAASMGGSQIFLEEGEQQTVRDLTKSIVMDANNKGHNSKPTSVLFALYPNRQKNSTADNHYRYSGISVAP